MTRWPRPTRRGVVLVLVGVVLFAVALFLDRRDLIFLALIGVALPLVALAFVALRRMSLHVSRAFSPSVVSAGGTARVSLLVTNTGRRSTDSARWRDISPFAAGDDASGPVPALGRHTGGSRGGDDTVELSYSIDLTRRGVFGVGPVAVTMSDPFGLATFDRAFGEAHDIIVTPRVSVLGGPRGGAAAIDGALQERLRQTMPNSDELIAREYRHGDPLRRVNWPATARHGELMVRQEEQRSNPGARLIIDTSMSGHHRHSVFEHADRSGHVDAGFERVVEMAASVGAHLLRSGFRLEVSETGPSILEPSVERTRGGLFGDSPTEFAMPGGDAELLESLAHLPTPTDRTDRRDAHDDDPRSAVRTPLRVTRTPGFAVLADIDLDEADALAALGVGFEPAVAFVLSTVGEEARERLAASGWTCVPLGYAQDLESVWESVDVSSGVVSNGR
ncbi:DUF58 domain-containing protein [Agromyces atrinae]|nr:DUF58 domain-containing protein [Agromyces atrinae]NYD65719.1 uncharacterized protein (DUF58 family) [Agromyces atrinae]